MSFQQDLWETEGLRDLTTTSQQARLYAPRYCEVRLVSGVIKAL